MLRTRVIRPGFFSNEYLAELDPLARILFEGLWCVADREGRLEDRPLRLKAAILPYDNCDVDALLQSLADCLALGEDLGFIVRYQVNGRRFIQVTNFLVHQGPHHKEAPSTIPAPLGWPSKPGDQQLLLEATSIQDRLDLEPGLNHASADVEPTLLHAQVNVEPSLNHASADVASSRSALDPLVTSPSPLTSPSTLLLEETTTRGPARKRPAKTKKSDEDLVFTDDERKVMDAVKRVFADFDFSPEPSWWRRIGFSHYGELDLEAEAFKQVAWLRANRKRMGALSRYTNWLDNAMDGLASRGARKNGGLSNLANGTNGKVHSERWGKEMTDLARDRDIIPIRGIDISVDDLLEEEVPEQAEAASIPPAEPVGVVELNADMVDEEVAF